MHKKISFEFVRTSVAILFSLAIVFVIILLASNEPLTAFSKMITGPFRNVRSFGNIIETMIPYIFTGLGVSIMFQASQINLGADGAFYIGAMGASVIAIKVAIPSGIHPIVAILVGGIIGGIVCLIPAILKVKWKASEIVSSLMLNYIMVFLGVYIINTYLRDINAGSIATVPFMDSARLIQIIPGTRIHIGLILAISMTVICYLFLYKSKWGYELRMTGQNLKFAKYSGINIIKVILLAQLIGGFIAGIGGATQILGMYTRNPWASTPGYGWDGFIVATLARNNPLYVPIAAFFLSFLRNGAEVMARQSDVPSEVVQIIQGVMIIFIAAESLLSHWKHKAMLKQTEELVVK